MLGIDVSKAELSCALYDRTSETFRWERRFPNSSAGVQRLLDQTDGETPWVLEPTGRFSQAVAKQARAAGRQVLLAPTRKAKDYLRSISSRAKTDRLDGRGLALFGATRTQANALRPYPIKSEPVEQLDQLLTARRGVVNALTALQLRARELPYAGEILKQAVLDLQARRQDLDQQIAAVTRSQRASRTQPEEGAKAEDPAPSAGEPAATGLQPGPTVPTAPNGTAAKAQAPAADNPLFGLIGRLRSVPGFGLVISAALASRLTDREFSRSDEFVAYIGLDVVVHQSGRHAGRRGLSKEGDAELRRLLYLAAASNVRSPGSPFRLQYDREQAKGLSRIAALNAVARKMARLAWSLSKHGGEYDPKRVHQQEPLQGGMPAGPAGDEPAPGIEQP